MLSMVCRLYDFLNSCIGRRRKIGEISNARCSGARMYDTLSVGCCPVVSSSKRGRRSLRSASSSAEKVCLQQSKLRKAVPYKLQLTHEARYPNCRADQGIPPFENEAPSYKQYALQHKESWLRWRYRFSSYGCERSGAARKRGHIDLEALKRTGLSSWILQLLSEIVPILWANWPFCPFPASISDGMR